MCFIIRGMAGMSNYMGRGERGFLKSSKVFRGDSTVLQARKADVYIRRTTASKLLGINWEAQYQSLPNIPTNSCILFIYIKSLHTWCAHATWGITLHVGQGTRIRRVDPPIAYMTWSSCRSH